MGRSHHQVPPGDRQFAITVGSSYRRRMFDRTLWTEQLDVRDLVFWHLWTIGPRRRPKLRAPFLGTRHVSDGPCWSAGYGGGRPPWRCRTSTPFVSDGQPTAGDVGCWGRGVRRRAAATLRPLSLRLGNSRGAPSILCEQTWRWRRGVEGGAVGELTRRHLLQYGAAGGAAVLVPGRFGARALSALGTGALDPARISEVRDAARHPAGDAAHADERAPR